MRPDISRLRIIAIVLIVLHHSLCVYYGWPPNENVGSMPEGKLATMVCMMSKEFGLSVFTFISGWLLWYGRHKVDNILVFIWRKVKRLLLPAAIWGSVYHVIFPNYEYSTFPSAVNGTHLWYLLMLFVCMVLAAPVVRWPRNRWAWYATIVLLVCVVLIRNMNRTFAATCNYLPIFMMGCAMNIISNKLNNSRLLTGGVIFVLLYILAWNMPLPNRYIFHVVKFCTMGIAIGASMFCIMQFISIPLYKVERIIDSSSFAIYLIHQFIIDAIVPFYRLEYPWWITIIIVVIVAIASSIIIRKAVKSIDKYGLLCYLV